MSPMQQYLLTFLLLSFGLRAQADRNEHQRGPNFPSCVSDCIEGSGCDAGNLKCICQASRGSFLPDVAACVHSKCSQAISVEVFLGPLEAACNGVGQPIPPAAISSAEAAGSSTDSTKPSATQAATTRTTTTQGQTVHATTSKATTPAPDSTTCTSSPIETESGASTSPQNSEGMGDTTTTPAPEPSTEVHLSFDASTQSTSSSETTTTTAGPVDPTDSSPFASPINSGSYHQEVTLSGIVISLVAALAYGW